MPTATRSSAPTEAEIRAMLAERAVKWPHDNAERQLAEAVDTAFDTIGYIELDELESNGGLHALSDLWADLRPSEIIRLHLLVSEARERAYGAAWEAIVREVVAAGLAFAAEFPNAPRAQPIAE
jgi:hypothetical protein